MRSLTLTVLATIALATGCVVSVGTRSANRTVVRESRPVHPAHLGIPPGHLPPPGKCRIWVPGRPPGHQPRPGSCAALRDSVPAGAWLVYRPSRDRKHVEVSMYDAHRPRTVVAVAIYEADSGRYVRDAK